MMISQNASRELPIALRPAVPLEKSVCQENLAPEIRLFADQLGRPSSRRIGELVKASGPASRIAYDRDALEYNRTFFLRNAVKCFVISQILLENQDRAGNGAVLDVGGGIGTFALSLSAKERRSSQLVVDRSSSQILLGRQLANFTHSAVHTQWTVSNDLPTAWSSDPIALFSFSLCESPQLLRSAVEKGWRTALVVDYPVTIDRCAAYASQIGASFIQVRASVELCPSLADEIGQARVSANGALIASN